jgi:putative chitinase
MSNKIAEFQAAHGLENDGSIGPKTISKLKEVLKIQTNESLAHLLGQCAVESGSFTASVENLNYGADGLTKIFGKYFTPALATAYARQPEKIANRVYANRMGNGDEKSGDGYKYRGRGAIQLTGKSNYKAFSDYIKEDCVANPDLVATKYFFESAMFFFSENNLWKFTTTVSTDLITKLSKAINLGNPNSTGIPHGLTERINNTTNYYKLLTHA